MALSPLTRALTTLAAGALLCAGLTPAGVAQTITPRQANSPLTTPAETTDKTAWDTDGNIIADNQKDLDDLITKARAAGVTVNETNQTLDSASDTNAASAKTNLEKKNEKSIQDLKDAIKEQEENNTTYEADIKAAVQGMFGDKWKVDDLNLGDQLTNLAVIVPSKDSEHPFTPGKDLLDLNDRGWLKIGDTWTYKNVLQDPATGKWVDLRFTLRKAWYRIDANDYERREPRDTVTLKGTKINTDKLRMYYGDYDVQVKVEFLSHDSEKPIKLNPLVIFTDVDAYQAVKIDEGKVGTTLFGTSVKVNENPNSKSFDGLWNYDGRDFDDSQKAYREFWAIYLLKETDSFTYTFFVGEGIDVIHGLGAGTLDFNRPMDKKHATADVSVYRQSVAHSLTYEVVGEEPAAESVTGMPGKASGLVHNSEVEIAGTIATSSTEKNGVDGTWAFKGWFTDKGLTTPAKDFQITQDTTLYGGWDFTPNKYKVTHEFRSADKNRALPNEIIERVPDEQAGKTTGETVTPGTFKRDEVEDTVNDGTWTFTGWDAESQKIDRADAHFIGTWTFKANTYKVTHEFVSGTENMDLPEAVTSLAPKEQTGIVNGTKVKPSEFKADPVKDPELDGFWTFQSWDNQELTIDKGDAKFVGTWVYVDNPKPVVPQEPKKSFLARTGTAAGLLSGVALALFGAGVLILMRRRQAVATPGPRHAAN